MNSAATWFRRFLWIGILQDVLMGMPAVFAPNWLLETLGQRPTQDPIWTSFAGLLVLALGMLYIPAAIDPYRYTLTAWLATIARTFGVFFFFVLNPGIYPAFGAIDLLFFVLQISTLIPALANKSEST